MLTGRTGALIAASFSSGGGRIVTVAKDETTRVWNAATGGAIAFLGSDQRQITKARFCLTGRRIVTTASDGTASLWDSDTGKELGPLTRREGAVSSVNQFEDATDGGFYFSADGARVLTTYMDGRARLWEIDIGNEIALVDGHRDKIWDAAFSPDGRFFATASRDGTARIWDAKTGVPFAVLNGHRGPVHGVRFSPDMTALITASADATARVWRLFPSTQALVDDAKRRTPRCLTPHQRRQLLRESTSPSWCVEETKLVIPRRESS